MDFDQIFSEHANMIFRICMLNLRNEQDAWDVVQDTFLKFLEKKDSIRENEHAKAWLIRVAVNRCTDIHRSHANHPVVSMDELEKFTTDPEEIDILSEVMQLPEKYQIVVYLHYIEGYRVKEIARILHISEFTVKKRLQRGREQLKLSIEQEEGGISCRRENSLMQLVKLN